MNTHIFEGRRFAVLLGGYAAEREISLESGSNVALALEAAGATVTRVDTAEEKWPERLQNVEFVFNLLHGPGGEDGTLQGLFDLMKLPYSGSGVLGSALTMDKVRTKRVWQGAGLPTPAFDALTADSDWTGLMERHGTLFVKPAREGSSIGMTKARTPQELQVAFEKAQSFGGEVLAETFVAGEEYTVAILGHRALPAIRIEPATDFYDFDAKYVSDATRFYCPSGLTPADETELATLALKAFAAVDCAVWGRVDVMRDAARQWQLLEVNTIPGMTSHSLVPMAARAAGLSMAELLAEIFRLSLEVRHASA